MTVKIYEITGDNTYCGPAVVSALTGKPTHHIAELWDDLRGKSTHWVTGLELIAFLAVEGFSVTLYPDTDQYHKQHLHAFVEVSELFDAVFVVGLKYHFVVVSKGKVSCSMRRRPAALVEGALERGGAIEYILSVQNMDTPW